MRPSVRKKRQATSSGAWPRTSTAPFIRGRAWSVSVAVTAFSVRANRSPCPSGTRRLTTGATFLVAEDPLAVYFA